VPDILNDAPDGYRDLLRESLTAVLTTIDVDGHPRSAAVWFFVDDDGQLKGSTYSDLYQFKDLRRNPRCSLLIIDFSDPFRTLEVRATAELTEDFDSSAVRKLAHKYGVDPAEAPPRHDRYTITYHPRQLLGRRFWAEQFLQGQGTEQ